MQEKLVEFAIATFMQALGAVPITERDRQQLDASNLPAAGPLRSGSADGQRITPGMWALYLGLIARHWEREESRLLAAALVMPDEFYDDAAAPGWHGLIDAAIDALAELAEMDPEGAGRTAALHRLAEEVNARGDSDNSYDLAAVALDLDQNPSPERLACARFGLALARSAGKAHQAAVMSAQLAVEHIAADDPGAPSVDAFEACEEAVERIFLAPSPYDELAAQALLRASLHHPVFRKVVAPLAALIPDVDERRDAIGLSHWPRRVQRLGTGRWAEELARILGALRYEHDIDAARLELDRAGGDEHASIDWINWSLDHPAYRRAIPNNQSFLREAQFDDQVLVLMHELTHAYSLLGGIGLALSALRIVGTYNELHLWSAVWGNEVDDLDALVADRVAAPLPPGEPIHLFRAERGIELAAKAQILQDVWTPWFEGLAAFAESAADPATDIHGISPVAAALRNLIDFEPDDEADSRAAFDAYLREFEERVSGAVGKLGWRRLYRNVLLNGRDTYVAGYFAVRAIVSAWRRSLGRGVSGSEAFTLLLHATRHGTIDAIPDLGLPAEQFAREAELAMMRWAANLAEIDPASLEHFLGAPLREAAGASYVWLDGRPVPLDGQGEIEAQHAREMSVRAEWLRQAETTLTTDADIEGFESLDSYCGILGSAAAEIIRDHQAKSGGAVPERQIALIENHLVRGSLFVLGQCSARFYLNIAPDKAACQFTTMLRTTEKHVDTGKPSVNLFSYPLEAAEAEALAAAYLEHPRPRVTANRVVDLIGLLSPRPGINFHFLAYRFDDWFSLRGATRTADKVFEDNPAYLEFASGHISQKLNPSPMLLAEQEIAKGRRCAERTRDWIARSAVWRQPGLEIRGDASAWASRVRCKADALLAPASRAPRWRSAGIALLGALWDERTARDVAETDFLDLCSGFPAEAAARAIFDTGALPGDNDWLATNGVAFNRRALEIFEQTPRGWDIRAAGRN